MTSTPSTADRLLDAQVAWVVEELTGDRLLAVVERDLDELLAMAAEVRVDDVVSTDDAIVAVELLLDRLPSSGVATTMAGVSADLVHAGPAEPVVPGHLVGRRQVEEWVDASLALRPLLGRALDRLTDSPLVGQLASRFITRLVVDVLEANRSLASRIPGVGSIVSFGTNAATRVVDAADKQVQSLLGGDAGGRGTAMAVRRLNSVVMGTLEDPTFRDAMLEVWDTLADEPIEGVAGVVGAEDLRRVVDALQEMAVSATGTPPVRMFVAAWVRTVIDHHRQDSVATLLRELGLRRADVLLLAQRLLPPLVEAARAEGLLERAVRARLEPFYRSPRVAAILSEA